MNNTPSGTKSIANVPNKNVARRSKCFAFFLSFFTNHIATKQLLFKMAELEIWLCVRRQGESLASTVDSVFEQSLIFQQILHASTDEDLTDLLLCDRLKTSAQACIRC